LKLIKIKIPQEYLELKRPIRRKEDTAKMVRSKEHNVAICTGMNRWEVRCRTFRQGKNIRGP